MAPTAHCTSPKLAVDHGRVSKKVSSASTVRRKDSTRSKRESPICEKKSMRSEKSELLPDDDEDSENVPKWKKVAKLAAPHLGLTVASAVYVLLGAYVFELIEHPERAKMKMTAMKDLHAQKLQLADKMLELRRLNLGPEASEEAFNAYAKQVYSAYKHRLLNAKDVLSTDEIIDINKRPNSFAATAFFIGTMLTTIGYGNIVPLSRNGRIFCICYSYIGLPLLLMTIADLAKFLSSGVMTTYRKYLEFKGSIYKRIKRIYKRCCCNSSVDMMTSPSSDDNLVDYLWDNVEDVHYVRLPPMSVFVLIIGYCCLGGLLLPQWEQWTFFEGTYFSFVSILMVGFGDFVPENTPFLALSFLYVFFGVVITTMCVDIVGGDYLLRLHNLGRKMGGADYLQLLQRSKHKRSIKRKKKEAMRTLFETLTFLKHMKVSHPRVEIVPEAPQAPQNIRVLNITPYSIRLSWQAPEGNNNNPITYRLTCKPKQATWRKKQIPIEIDNIQQPEIEVQHLQSFSIYEISIAAVNQFGRSNSMHIVQITEPETAPQNIFAQTVNPTSIRLEWQSPEKKKESVQRYTIYYTKNPIEPYENWTKITTNSTRRSLTLDELDENATYAFSVAANYLTGHSPLSRSLFATTAPDGPQPCLVSQNYSSTGGIEDLNAADLETTYESYSMSYQDCTLSL